MKNNYYINQLGIKNFWDKNIHGKGIVGVLDTGYTPHSFIPDNVVIDGKNFTNEGIAEDFTDGNGHGTAVISTIYNICPDCKIIIAKVLKSDGSGSASSMIKGMEYLINCGVDIINCSLGTTVNDPRMKEICDKAVAKGISIVAASGNEGDDNADTDEICYPAYYENTIEVGAIDENNKITDFSNSNTNVDVVTYGKDIKCCGIKNNYKTMDGTSFSTPITTAVMLLLKQSFSENFKRKPTDAELYAYLIKNTEVLPNVSNNLQGFGRIYIDDIF